jgi:hypothetical protein
MKTEKQTAKPAPLPIDSEDFKHLVDLVALYTDASNSIKSLEADANAEFLEILDDKKPTYAKLQAVLTDSETALEALALKHPEWFQTRKSIKTPYGTVKLTKSTKLSVKNEELSIVLIERALENSVGKPNYHPLAELLRTRIELNLEALEKLDDDVLKAFKIQRIVTDNFSVVPAEIDMGKAVKQAAESEAA